MVPSDGNSQNMLLLPDDILGGFTKPIERESGKRDYCGSGYMLVGTIVVAVVIR